MNLIEDPLRGDIWGLEALFQQHPHVVFRHPPFLELVRLQQMGCLSQVTGAGIPCTCNHEQNTIEYNFLDRLIEFSSKYFAVKITT